MKWMKDIKANTKSWFGFLSGLVLNTTTEPDDTAIINDCFATYLQKIAAERIKPIPCDDRLLPEKYDLSSESNLKPTEIPLRVLSPLKQVS